MSACQIDPICGNGVAEGDEVCDGDDFAGATCEMLGEFVGGNLQCPDTCDLIGTLGCLSPGEGTHCETDVDCPVEAPNCTNRTCWNGSETDPCQNFQDCHPNMMNGSCIWGHCWDGSEGDPCYDSNQCTDAAPYCSIDMHCHDGSEGDPCATDSECVDAPFCVMVMCSMGNEGDPCMDPAQCATLSQHCVDFTCYDGSEGDPCDVNANCEAEAPFCSELTDACQTGEPGTPCSLHSDCESGSCDVNNEVCN